jgi:hypothetical protein
VSSRGVTRSTGSPRSVGYPHRQTLVDIDVPDAEFHIYDQAGASLAAIIRTSGKETTRPKATVSASESARDRHPSPDVVLSPMS